MSVLFDSLNPNLVKVLDSAAGEAAAVIADMADELDIAELNQQNRMLRIAAISLVLVFTDSIVSNDLADDELPSDRFAALLAGFSGSEDGDEVEIDPTTLDIITAHVKDAFETLGVTDESLIDAAFGDNVTEADQALEAIAETVESNVPPADEISEFVQAFVFGDAVGEIGEDGLILDSASLGKTTVKQGKFGKVIYKAIKAVRKGKITVVNKRVNGKVKLTAKQKAALNKARVKAFSSAALNQRFRSVTKGKRAGLY
jgi:hypothetical protein